jgi:hypothetical protein
MWWAIAKNPGTNHAAEPYGFTIMPPDMLLLYLNGFIAK